jgi:crotonobetainyl-CoA:carnitine CoA-transferase CaiB-like acyl-CoA transferase
MFKDLKIVELASVLAGPLVGTFFSELGAEVVKIENASTAGDVTRKWKLPSEKKEDISAYYASANYNKKVLMLNLKEPKDYRLAIKEIESADIVIANYKFGDAKKMALDYVTLKKLNPTIIYGEINGYGAENKRTAFDVVLQAESGFMFMNGSAESGPIKMPVALIDILAAHQLKEGLLCAIIKKLKTNEGSNVTVSLYDAAVSSLVNQATNWLMAKHVPQPLGTKHPNIAPYGDMFLSKDDKYIVLAVGANRQFDNLCKALLLEVLKDDIRFIDNSSRVTNRISLNVYLQNKIYEINATDCIELFLSLNVPAGIVKNMEEVFQNPLSESLILKENIEGTNTTKLKTAVFKIS